MFYGQCDNCNHCLVCIKRIKLIELYTEGYFKDVILKVEKCNDFEIIEEE